MISIITAFTGVANIAYVLFAFPNISRWYFNNLTPQGVIVVLCAFGILSCLVNMSFIPLIVRDASVAAQKADPVKRASLLGLVGFGLITLLSEPVAY